MSESNILFEVIFLTSLALFGLCTAWKSNLSDGMKNAKQSHESGEQRDENANFLE
jgi:hypothetical protein